MTSLTRKSDAVHWYMSELGSRVVAESGIPSDRHHLGKLTLQGLKDAPDFILQIDGATGQSETFSSVLERSVKCATAIKKLGVKLGEPIVIIAPSHLDVTVPFHAGLFLGLPVAPLDLVSGALKLSGKLDKIRPKMIFCENKVIPDVKEALKNIDHQCIIISFGVSDCLNFVHFLDKYGQIDDVANFRAADFDPAETTALLLSTSGTTGLPKSADLTHKNFAISIPCIWKGFRKFPTPTNMALLSSPNHWLSATFHFMAAPFMRYTRLQTSAAFTQEHIVDLINTYKPTFSSMSPTFVVSLINPSKGDPVDITSFDMFLIGGSAVPHDLVLEIKAKSPKTKILNMFGMSEIAGCAFYDDNPAPGSMGRPIGTFEYRLIDIETKEDVVEPHVNGELWLRGPSICKGYYNDPEETKESFTEDGWFKTGDIFYRDENYFFYFVDRLKLLLDYKNYRISPVEVELVIRQHPGVLDVAVTGVPDRESGDLVVACVVRRMGYKLTAQEIKDLVKNSLADSRQLRGGVVFMEKLPMTSTTKLDRQALKKIVFNSHRE